MKFALNGALTIGTLDGANVEIREAVGADNFFLFGLTVEEIASLHQRGYDPRRLAAQDEELGAVLDMLVSGELSPAEPQLFRPLYDSLLAGGDRYLLLADFRSYLESQEAVARLYRDPEEWTRRAILNAVRPRTGRSRAPRPSPGPCGPG